jgi:nitrogen fixation NifU-like protein
MEKLYNEEILKHAKTPQFASKVKKIAASGHAVNQFCGDEVDVELSCSKGVINDVYINSKGCSINIASSSLMAGEIKNLDPNQVATLINNYKSFMDGKTLESKYKKNIGSLEVMESVKAFPIRIKCAVLGTLAVEDAISRLRI